ncbi:hypothetical protein [Sutcliffiella horikoshii]|uniref:hypothetical protein n=1 Tax=Sutcliffiella horikoshii TaxID=79883 RepID=UPI001CFCF24B|nr:hypothetical protein [Sutcliffiella horikoshii]
MKINKYLLVFMILISIGTAGCSSGVKGVTAGGHTIEVQERIGDEDNYEIFKVITDEEQVKKGKELLDDLDWEDAKVSMVRPADFRFSFPNPEAKAILYELWIGPNKDSVELVINAESKYIKMEKNKSAELYDLLTGEKLSDVE